MWKKLQSAILTLTLILGSCNSSLAESGKYIEYTGSYLLKTDLILDVKEKSGLLTLLPSFWGTTQILDSIGPDKFCSLLHPRMEFEFTRDGNGEDCITHFYGK